MKVFVQTERLILREILPSDEAGFFEMDSNPLVHRYLGNNPVKTLGEIRAVIENIRSQYDKYGIGRWAVIEKTSGQFIGWAGLKYITEPENGRVHFHDVGYRLMPKYWGKGYATESAKAALQCGFEVMKLEEIIGTCHIDNHASRRALEKCGLTGNQTFEWRGIPCYWLSIKQEQWRSL